LGATTLGTSRTPAKLEQARAIGLDIGIDTSNASFRDQVHEPVNLVIDVLGGPAFADNLAILAPRGRLVMLGFLQGPEVQTSLDPMLRKRLQVIGSVMRTRLLPERVALVREFEAEVLPWMTETTGEAATGGRAEGPAGRIGPIIAATYSFTEIAEAHRAMEANEPFGKIVLTW
jgi:NADPH2:quinone reductase